MEDNESQIKQFAHFTRSKLICSLMPLQNQQPSERVLWESSVICVRQPLFIVLLQSHHMLSFDFGTGRLFHFQTIEATPSSALVYNLRLPRTPRAHGILGAFEPGPKPKGFAMVPGIHGSLTFRSLLNYHPLTLRKQAT